MRKRHLAIELSKLELPGNPKEKYEQYPTPSELAANVLNMAFMAEDVEDKIVYDLGCGNGIFGIGAAILGAKKITCVDIDPDMIALAKKNANNLGLDIEFIKCDVDRLEGKCDTVFQNPPFGMRGRKKSDRIFLKKSLEISKKVYSIHRGGYRHEKSSKTREFLTSFVEEHGGIVKAVKAFKFDVPYMFKFHKKPKVSYNVDLFVIEKS